MGISTDHHSWADPIKPRRVPAKSLGFTMIELIVVIVIVGILAATVLPNFLNLSQSARASVVGALAGTLSQAANNIRMLCVAKTAATGCDVNSPLQQIRLDGQWYWLNFGFPDSGDTIGLDEIDMAVSYSGFTLTLPNNLSTRFTNDGAPTPQNCSVLYVQATSSSGPTITVDTSGC